MLKILPHLQKKYTISSIVQLGDLADCAEFSSFPRNKVSERLETYGEEVEFAKNFWNHCNKVAPKADKVWIAGNHEARLERYIIDQIGHTSIAKEVYNAVAFEKVARDVGARYVPYGEEGVLTGAYPLIKGVLFCIHGWSATTHAAANHLNKVMGSVSIIMGHTHRIQSIVRRNPITDMISGAWSIGALSKCQQGYNKGHPNDHALGMAYVLQSGKHFQVCQVHICGGKAILPDGTVIQ
jgi:hypothetical protein